MSRARRIKPSTREGRKRQAELGRVISNPRTLKTDREAATRELDALAPLENFGSPSLTPPAPPTQDWKEALIDRVEARREGTVFDKGSLEEALARLAVEDRARAIRNAENATPLEKAQTLICELPDHPLNKLARELAAYLWREDQSNPKPNIEQMVRWTVKGWLARQPYNRSDVRGDVQTVSDAVDDLYRLLSERDIAEPGWFVRRAEKLLNSQAVLPVKKTEPVAEPALQTYSASLQKEEVQPLNENLAARVSLVLAADSSLSRLAAHSPEYDSGIRAALRDRLLSRSNCDGSFLAGLYNAMRPRNLSAFPPRTF